MMYKKFILVLLFVAMLIMPVFAYPYATGHTYTPSPGSYATTQYIDHAYTMAGLTDACYLANSGNVKWYWADNTPGTSHVIDAVASCDGAFSCSYYPNVTGYSGYYQLVMTVPGEFGGNCYINTERITPGTDLISGSLTRFVSSETSGLASPYHFTTYLPPVIVTFSLSETGNFTQKLSGVNVLLSTGRSGTSNATGMVTIGVVPNVSTHTYDLIKTGYVSKYFQPLGGYGITGGILYDTMDLNTGLLPTGYTRTVVKTIDALTGQQLIGTTINLRDVQNNSWLNSTADVDGVLIIDVITGHTLDIYGSYPGVYTATYELGAVAGGTYLLPLYPPVPTAITGNVNMFVNVKEAVSGLAINGANVDFRYPSGTTIHAVTDWAGIAQVQVPNKTVIIIGTSASGFNSQSESVTTGDFADTVRTVRLSKSSGPGATATVTATVTDPATGLPITAVPTYQPYCNPTAADYDERLCSQSKDNDLMAQLRDNGSVIMSLAILAIIFGLLKMIMKF